MRLRRLALLRYGHLSDLGLEFPVGARLCVVHGPNEAGKSTALAAIGDALFGFGHKTDFDFLHSAPNLRVAVTLALAGGAEQTFIRRKGRSNTLRNAAEEIVPEAALQLFLGGAGRELFEHMFGLNGERLREGGAALAQGGGAVGESLFAAGTGLLGLRHALNGLDEEAKALFGARGKRRLTDAVERWKEASRHAEQISILPSAWRGTEAAREKVAGELSQVQVDVARLQIEANRLQRVRRVLPLLAGLDAAGATLAELADAPRLPADAEAAMRRAVVARDAAAQDAARETQQAERLTDERDALVRDPALLADQDAIDRLAEQRPIAVQAASDLPGVRLTVEGLRNRVQEAAAEIAPGLPAEAARDAVPSDAARRAVQALTGRHASLTAKLEAAERDLAAATLRRGRVEAALTARPMPPDPAELRATIDAARGEGRLDAELAEAASKAAASRAAATTALTALPLWPGDAFALAAARLPLPAEMAEAGDRLAQAQALVREAEAEAERIAQAMATIEEALTRLSRGETVATAEAVHAAREARDDAWRGLRRALEAGKAEAVPEMLPDAYERLLAETDRLADRRADEAQRVADYMAAVTERDLLGDRQARAAAALSEARGRLTEAQTAWRGLWASAGLAPASPAAMEQWVRARAEVLRLETAAADAERHRAVLAGRYGAARSTLLPLLAGIQPAATLADLLRHAELACGKAEIEASQHRSLGADLTRETAGLPGLRQAADGARQALAAWATEWAGATAVLGLTPGCTVQAAEAALSAWGRIAEAAPAWRADERRIGQMASTAEDFVQSVRAVLAVIGAAPTDEPAPVAANGLVRRLAEARRAEEQAAGLEARIRHHADVAIAAQDVGRVAAAELAVLRERAGATDDAGLEVAILRARRRGQAAVEAETLRAALTSQGDGRDEAALRAEAEGSDPDQAVARLAEIEREMAGLGTRREALSAERTRLEAELAAMRQGRDAATAAQEASHALAEAGSAAERYARLHLARVLLRSGIDRFRKAQQGPLLQAASRYFATLTGGRYIRLGVEQDETGPPSLVAVGSDGAECPVGALSDGARDQLYLALRAAAIEAHAAGAEPLPFIADDLLVHFDDGRSAAAIDLLAHLGRTTQVILFTHHDHVAELAAARAEDGVVVIRFS